MTAQKMNALTGQRKCKHMYCCNGGVQHQTRQHARFELTLLCSQARVYVGLSAQLLLPMALCNLDGTIYGPPRLLFLVV